MFSAMVMGHLVGDYLVQNDWMAANKKRSSLVCLCHCAVYTAAIALFTWGRLPAAAYAAILASHFVLDRWSLVPRMMRVTGKAAFTRPPMAPWSVIVTDNILHLLVLYALPGWAR